MATISGAKRYFLLFIVMFLVAEWMVLNLYFSSLGQKQQILTKITNSPLIDLIYDKTGLRMSSFQIAASDRLYGLMIGVPGKPYMMLSSKLNDIFSESEKEYVVLHETGHYLLHHSIKELIFFLMLFGIGSYVIRNRSIFLIPIVGIVLGLSFIQFGMVCEDEADRFAVSRMTDPTGMITATEKFRKAHYPPLDDYSLRWRIFYRSVPYHDRIAMAEKEIEVRSKQ